MTTNKAKPFVKWLEGKGQLIDSIAKHLPIGFNQKNAKILSWEIKYLIYMNGLLAGINDRIFAKLCEFDK